MVFRRRIKIYTHHNLYHETTVTRKSHWVWRALTAPFRAGYYVCYAVGLPIFRIIQSISSVPKIARMGTTHARFALTTFVVLIVAVSLTLHSALLVATGQQLKGKVLGSADQGITHLNQAQTALQNQDTTGINEQLRLALQNFETSRSDLNSSNIIVQNLLALIPQKQDADALLEASALLTEGGLLWNRFYELTQLTTVGPQGIVRKDQESNHQANTLAEMNQAIQAGKQKIDRAITLLQTVSSSVIPADKREAFVETKDKLTILQRGIVVVGDAFQLLTDLSTGTKNTLLLFQNNNELRATGGFIGTYGAMRITDGQINQLHISSIYDLDGQLKQTMVPPHPIKAVNNQWFMRDSNWWTDFPTTAQTATAFYEKEGGETPDLVIGMTPEVIIDLLHITGPILLPRYNVTFTPENFVELSQLESSVNYDKDLNQPKQILADFVPALLQQINQLPGPQLLPVLMSLQKNIQGKQLLFYARDTGLQQQLEAFNWAGSIRSTDRDFLLVSESNLGGTKTDRELKKETTLVSEIDIAGKITNHLTISRTNPLPNRPEFKQRSYIRIYVPEGSELIEARGFTPISLPTSVVPGTTDFRVSEWERNALIDNITGTFIGKENGKTVFGNWLEVPGGEQRTITITYTLPFILGDTDHHSLLVQKQPGSIEGDLHYVVKFPGHNLEWKNRSTQAMESHKLSIKEPLHRDYFFGFIFKQP